jgi:hypothetical protein
MTWAAGSTAGMAAADSPAYMAMALIWAGGGCPRGEPAAHGQGDALAGHDRATHGLAWEGAHLVDAGSLLLLHHPLPMKGIFVAVIVRNCTLASRGRLAM